MNAAPATRHAGGWDCHVHVFKAGAPTRAGHYAPDHAPLAAIEDQAAACGIHHLVLVQPSVYGTDNGVMQRALGMGAGRHRGIAVVDPAVDDATLDSLADAGVRGIRFNLVSPLGNDSADVLSLAPRLRARGWHAQWYADHSQLERVAQLQAESGLTFVLDHLAGLRADEPVAPESWRALQQIADAGGWVKLSGWYRLGATEPYDALAPMLRRVAAIFGDRLVWGSDWPHTSLPRADRSRFGSLMGPVRQALGDAVLAQVLQRGAVLYGS